MAEHPIPDTPMAPETVALLDIYTDLLERCFALDDLLGAARAISRPEQGIVRVEFASTVWDIVERRASRPYVRPE